MGHVSRRITKLLLPFGLLHNTINRHSSRFSPLPAFSRSNTPQPLLPFTGISSHPVKLPAHSKPTRQDKRFGNWHLRPEKRWNKESTHKRKENPNFPILTSPFARSFILYSNLAASSTFNHRSPVRFRTQLPGEKLFVSHLRSSDTP